MRRDIIFGLILTGLLFLFLPGQNYYQTLKIAWREPPVKAVAFSPPATAKYPVSANEELPSPISAESAIIIDVDSAVVMYEKNPNERLSPASTTKIMTAIIALENYKLSDIFTVKTLDTTGAQMGLKNGERLTVENLLYGLLINSGNDAAYTIAENFSGGIEQFIYTMNKKAKELNLFNTHFSNFNGLVEPNHYTTSLDLARLAVYALSKPEFAKIVGTSETIVTDIEKKRFYKLINVNRLLGKNLGITGIKTGWTEEAGECLVASAERNGQRVIIVVLKSSDRFGETEKLIEWAYRNHKWEEVRLDY